MSGEASTGATRIQVSGSLVTISILTPSRTHQLGYFGLLFPGPKNNKEKGKLVRDLLL